MIKSITIKGQKYKIIFSDLPSGTAGECDKAKKVITIDKSMEGHRDVYSTLLHEMIHAVFNEVSLDQALSDEMEELIADNIANAVYEEFFSKKGVKKWSTDE